MIIKKGCQGEFKQLLFVLRAAVLDNRTQAIFFKNKFRYIEILNLLQTSGMIDSYEERAEIIIVGLKQTYWKSFREPIKAFSHIETPKFKKTATVSNKMLTKHLWLTNRFPLVVASTDRGILSGQQAAAAKVGGIPLFTIY